jgi:hypothetical protein
VCTLCKIFNKTPCCAMVGSKSNLKWLPLPFGCTHYSLSVAVDLYINSFFLQTSDQAHWFKTVQYAWSEPKWGDWC